MNAVVLIDTGDFNTDYAPKRFADSMVRDEKSDGRILSVLSSGGKSNLPANSGGSKNLTNLKNEKHLVAVLEAVVGGIVRCRFFVLV